MLDYEIRNILISYLESTRGKIRIYQEKIIGASRCDVMAVTDILTGYEIKSDGDNLLRLPEQIKSYDRAFNKNYVVISNMSVDLLKMKIPYYWGIIKIENSDIEILRVAQLNKNTDIRTQLSLLWKIELKNLLMENKLPLYFNKTKGFIKSVLANSVDKNTLTEQIAEELLKRDYNKFAMQDLTIYRENTDEIPDMVDTLSELDPKEFTLDKWINIYNDAMKIRERKEEKFEQPVIREPHSITYENITVALGVPWVSKQIIDEFIVHILEKKDKWIYSVYEKITGSWSIVGKRSASNISNAVKKFGTPRYNALYILEATLNIRPIKIYDGLTYNEEETVAALEKQKELQEEFKRWIWLDEDRKWLVEEAYNKMFDGIKVQAYDGHGLKFPEMNENINLYDYQKDAVAKIINSDNTLLAFDVGAGKTYIMIAAAMKMREMGLSRKNMFVVPNNIVGQWEKIFLEMYPDAKVLAVEPKVFKINVRQKIMKQIQHGDYDGIIIAYSCFEMIPISAEAIEREMNVRLNILSDEIKKISKAVSINILNKERERIEKLTHDFIASMNYESGDITFDNLGVNTLFVDEAHNYKNIKLHTKLKNPNGINTNGSPKCKNMMYKVRCVQEQNRGRGVVFATGTPLCNSIADVYTMQMYLMPQKMQELHLDVFDNWVKTFATPETVCEVDVDTSKFRFIERFAEFHNLPELSLLFSQIAVFYSMKDTKKLPEIQGYDNIQIPKSLEMTKYMYTLCERSKSIRSRKIDKHYDNMLKVSIDGRKAALDLRLVGKNEEYDKTSKIYNCIENVLRIYNEYPGQSQVIFCDYSTPKAEDFNVYSELKSRLTEKGIPEKEIAFVHSATTESRKLKLYEKVNNGEVRIIIGSTFKLGIGANIQQRLIALHHLDVPWRPADMVQREGRILRYGNTNDNVFIYRYVKEGSFDSYSWQVLETKQRFISQFLSGTNSLRSIKDLEDNILTYAEVKAIAFSNPKMKELSQIEYSLRNAQIAFKKEMEYKEGAVKKLIELEGGYEKLSEKHKISIENLKVISKLDFKAIREILSPHIQSLNIPRLIIGGRKLFEFYGIEVVTPQFPSVERPCVILSLNNAEYKVEMSSKPAGNITRIVNFLKSFDKHTEQEKAAMNKMESDISELKKSISAEQMYNERVRKLEKERNKLFNEIDGENVQYG